MRSYSFAIGTLVQYCEEPQFNGSIEGAVGKDNGRAYVTGWLGMALGRCGNKPCPTSSCDTVEKHGEHCTSNPAGLNINKHSTARHGTYTERKRRKNCC